MAKFTVLVKSVTPRRPAQTTERQRPVARYAPVPELLSDSQAMSWGRLHEALLSFELLLRSFLLRDGRDDIQGRVGSALDGLKAGDSLPSDALTNQASLRQLICAYNARVSPPLHVGSALADIRDVLTSGRLLSPAADAGVRLVRFRKPANGRAVVDAVEVLTDQRVREMIEHVHDAAVKVRAAWPPDEGPSSR